MEQSEEVDQLEKALIAFQDESGFVKATKENPFLKNKYADYNTIVSQCRPKLAEQGLIVKQLLVHVEGKAAVYTRLKHPVSKQWMSGITPLAHKDNDPQSQGSAITYMKRYAYVAILDLLVDADDDGNFANGVGEKADKKKEAAEFYAEKSKYIKSMTIKGMTIDQIGEKVFAVTGKKKIESLADIKKLQEAK